MKVTPEGGKALRTRRPLILLGGLVFFLHILVTGGHLMSPDEELLFRMTEGLARGGSTAVVPLEGELSTGALPPGFPPEATFATRYNPDTGLHHAQYLPLQPLLAVPIYWVSLLLEGPLAEPFASVLGPGMHMQYIADLEGGDHARAAFRRGFLVMVFGPLVAAASAIMLARMGRLLTGSRGAGLLAGGAWALGTIAWPHSRTFFTEPLAGLFFLAALEQVIRWHAKPPGGGVIHGALVGVFLALGNLTRVDGPFFTVGVIAVMIWLAGMKYRAGGRPFPFFDLFLAGSIALAAWILLQTLNTLRFGTADVTSGYGQQVEGVKFTTPLLVGLHGLLFSAGKGMFFFSPALVLGLWGWMKVPGHLRWVRTATFLGFLPFFLAMAKWQNWDGGWCWGPRHVVQVHLPIMLGVVFLHGRLDGLARKGIFAVIMALGAAVQLYGSSQSPLEYYREYFHTYRDLVYHPANFRPMQLQAIYEEYAFFRRNRDGSLGREIPMEQFDLPAPMIDSLYLPEHTQWASYRQMWRLGHGDWYFWNAVTGRRSPDRWSMP